MLNRLRKRSIDSPASRRRLLVIVMALPLVWLAGVVGWQWLFPATSDSRAQQCPPGLDDQQAQDALTNALKARVGTDSSGQGRSGPIPGDVAQWTANHC